MARPTKVIDPQSIEMLAGCGCTVAEIAAKLGCSKDTIERRFAAVLKKGRGCRNISLRRKQFELAIAGNVTMLIWLGKLYLEQRERVTITIADFTNEELIAEANRRLLADAASVGAEIVLTGTTD